MRSPRRRGWRHPKGLDRDVRPNPDVYREGWRLLRNAGIELTDFEPDLRAELAAVNARFLDGFRYSTEAEQRNTADGAPYWIPFAQNNGHFTVKAEKHEFRTRWTACGEKAIYAFDGEHNVALAKNARCFEEIDDPSALPFTNYTLKVNEGEIVVYRDDQRGFLLVQVREVHDLSRGAEADKLGVWWQARAAKRNAE